MQIRGLPRPEADLGQGMIMDTGRGNDWTRTSGQMEPE
jgi:hypothetical protein